MHQQQQGQEGAKHAQRELTALLGLGQLFLHAATTHECLQTPVWTSTERVPGKSDHTEQYAGFYSFHAESETGAHLILQTGHSRLQAAEQAHHSMH